MDNTCDNCGRNIEVAIFKGTGSCSADCSKALGRIGTDRRNMLFVTDAEKRKIEKMRAKKKWRHI